MYRRESTLRRPTSLGPPSVRRCNSEGSIQHFVHEQTENEQLASEAVEDFYNTTDDEISAEILLIKDFEKILDLSQTNTDDTNAGTSQNSTQTETDTYAEELSPDLFSPDADISLELPTLFQYPTKACVEETNNNLVNPGALTQAGRRVLPKLVRIKKIEPSITLQNCIAQTVPEQIFTVCTLTRLPANWKKPERSGNSELDQLLVELLQRKLVLGRPSSRINSAVHSKQVTAGPDLSVSDNITELKLLISLAKMSLSAMPSRPRSASPDFAKPGCSYHKPHVPSMQAMPSTSKMKPQDPPDIEATESVESASCEFTDIDEYFDDEPTIVEDNADRSLLINNIDIYKNIHADSLRKYQLNGVPFVYVIVTGVITAKSATKKCVTQLEVDDGTAVVNCLFDDLLCLPEHRNHFHKFLDIWEHNLPLFRRDAEFDETFQFMCEYGKRLFQETPQSDDLNLGDEVTIIGKIHDSKNEGRVIYHKFLWRQVDLGNRENHDYVQDQFAQQDRHF